MSVCLCVGESLPRLSQTVFDRFLMKLGRMIDNDERQVPFEDELNRFIRTEVTENPYL